MPATELSCDFEFCRSVVMASAPPPDRRGRELARAWRGLVSGESTIVDSFSTQERSYLVIEVGKRHTPLSQRSREILEHLLCGVSAKQIALEMGVAQSTVTAVLKRSLAVLGLGGLPSRVPLSLGRLAHAACSPAPAAAVFRAEVRIGDRTCEVINTLLPNFRHVLPPAIEAVVHMRVCGKTYAEIAAYRSTSPRTVANQLSTAFQKLGVSGRSGIFEYVLSPPQPLADGQGAD